MQMERFGLPAAKADRLEAADYVSAFYFSSCLQKQACMVPLDANVFIWGAQQADIHMSCTGYLWICRNGFILQTLSVFQGFLEFSSKISESHQLFPTCAHL